MGWAVKATPRPFYPRERDPIPIVQEAVWAPGPVWTDAENLDLTGIRSPDRTARSESLYGLRHPGPVNCGEHSNKSSSSANGGEFLK